MYRKVNYEEKNWKAPKTDAIKIRLDFFLKNLNWEIPVYLHRSEIPGCCLPG
jgi:hypothetical protein